MKKVFFIFGMLLSVGMFCACSSDDGLSDLMNDKLTLFEDSLQSVPENDYTGYLYYDRIYDKWTIVPGIPIDYASTYYFPLNLPDECKSYKDRSVKVSFSGKVVKLSDEEVESSHLWQYDGTESFYFVYLTKIEIIEGGGEIPYRGNPPFTITDMPGMMVDFNTGIWRICYVKDNKMVNFYYPKEIIDEFKIQSLKVKISGNVYEKISESEHNYISYKIDLTKIEKAE